MIDVPATIDALEAHTVVTAGDVTCGQRAYLNEHATCSYRGHEIPMTAYAEISLREVTPGNEAAVRALDVWPHQRELVESNARSLEEARSGRDLHPLAVYAGDEPVGFLLLRQAPETGRFELWRLMIARQHQRRGYGRRAVEALVAALQDRPDAAELRVSYLLEDGHPGSFYAALGFEETGERIGYPGDPLGYEAVMRLSLRGR